MPRNQIAEYQIRRWYVQEQEILTNESYQSDEGAPLRKILIAAAIKNPYAGRFSEDLGEIVDASDKLGEEFARRIVAALGGAQAESYGKACVVGIAGEYEHGNAFITARFATPIRAVLPGAKEWIPSTGKRSGPGALIDIPLAHMGELYVRSHYDTMTVHLDDAPNADEVIVAFVVATRGRIHARLDGPKAPELKAN
ncbi:amino acid synthesis family protein [uncultured Roseibium sp.]|uniref:amino acid synthesis family protein n=1 Tax=uncultured Roseibium sp. TaxID=1936171 RepID=UPI0032163510